jgi:hypothetical protein
MPGSNGAAAAVAPAVPPKKVFVTRARGTHGKRQVVMKEENIAFLNTMVELLAEDDDRFAGPLIKWELISYVDDDHFADPRQLVGLGRRLLKADLHALFNKDFETDEDGSAYDVFIESDGGVNGVMPEDRTIVVYAKAKAEWTRLASAYLNRLGGESKSIKLLNEFFFGLSP